MHYKFQIIPRERRTDLRSEVLAYVATDPRTIFLDDGRLRDSVVFCEDADEANENLEKYRQYDVLDAWVGRAAISEHGIVFYQECADESREVMRDFLKWGLRTLRPCRVVDLESSEDLTEIAESDPDAMFDAP